MSFKETLFTKYLTIRNLFIWGNVLMLLLFLTALVKDTIREWKGYQKTYYKMEAQRLQDELQKSTDPEEEKRLMALLKNIKSQPIKIKQVMQERMGRYDRCTTCHLPLDPALNPSLVSSYDQHPFVAKPNPVHKAHPVEQFGCTVCHGGQGLATTVKDAHGEVKHWEKPLLRGEYLQASCVKCHGNADDEKAMPYTTAWRRGAQLFREKGCIGCHQVKGQGGPISVDLAEDTSDKPLGRIDFTHTGLPKDQWTLANWIRMHFVKDPQELVPGDPEGHFNDEPIAPSGMPFFDLAEDDARAVTTYVLAMAKDNVPTDYYVAGPRQEEPVFKSAAQHGRHVYEKYGCAACHGPDAKGGIRNYNYENEVEPDLTKSVGTFSREELREKIQVGVPVVGKKNPKGPTPPLYMPAWKEKIKGQELEDMLTYLFSIAEKGEEW